MEFPLWIHIIGIHPNFKNYHKIILQIKKKAVFIFIFIETIHRIPRISFVHIVSLIFSPPDIIGYLINPCLEAYQLQF